MDKVWGKNGNSLRIGNGNWTKDWYEVPESLLRFINTIKIGDEVKIKFNNEDNRRILTSIFPVATNKTNTINVNVEIGHMVSRTLVGLQNVLDHNTVNELINSLWDKYKKKINE